MFHPARMLPFCAVPAITSAYLVVVLLLLIRGGVNSGACCRRASLTAWHGSSSPAAAINAVSYGQQCVPLSMAT